MHYFFKKSSSLLMCSYVSFLLYDDFVYFVYLFTSELGVSLDSISSQISSLKCYKLKTVITVFFFFFAVHVETYEKKEGKRNYQRLSYCCFCKNSYHSKISKHILAVHATEPEVLQISALQLKSTERKIALQKLQKKGNYYHNCDVSICLCLYS